MAGRLYIHSLQHRPLPCPLACAPVHPFSPPPPLSVHLHKGLNSHELDQDVERGARGVLQGVTDGVTNHSSLVTVAALTAQLACMGGGASLCKCASDEGKVRAG